MELTRSFTADQFARALESWDWTDIQGKQPLFTSPFGDVFFQTQDGFWFLDLLEGALTRPWSDADALQAELNTAEGQDRTSWPGWRSRPSARASSVRQAGAELQGRAGTRRRHRRREHRGHGLRGHRPHRRPTAPPGRGSAARKPHHRLHGRASIVAGLAGPQPGFPACRMNCARVSRHDVADRAARRPAATWCEQ